MLKYWGKVYLSTVLTNKIYNLFNLCLADYARALFLITFRTKSFLFLISQFLSEYARALTKDKKFKEALSVISLCAQVGDKLIIGDNPQKLKKKKLWFYSFFQMTSLSTDEIQEFGAELIDFYSVHIGKGTFNTDPWWVS